VYIRPSYNRGEIVGNVPAKLEALLQNEFVWYDINDLTNPVYFYSNKVMYLGLMFQVAEFITEYGIECTVNLPNLDKLDRYDWKFIGTYRAKQKEAVNALYASRYGALKAPPGFGKTTVASALIARIGLKTAIIVQAGEPFDQAYNTILKMTNIKHIGRVSGEYKDLGDVTVYMIQTLSNEIAENPKGEIATAFAQSQVVIVDEHHHSAADTYLLALNFVTNPQFVFGFSATPEDREDGLQPFVNAYIGRPVFEVTYGEQIAHGHLCPVTVYVMRMPERDFGYSKNRSIPAFRKRQLYQEVYQEYVVENRERNNEALFFTQDMIDEGHSVAIIVSRIPHAHEIHKLYPQAVVLTSSTPKSERRDILEKLRSKEIMCVVTTLFDEATDVPSLGAVCMLAGGKTEIRLRQRIRSTRTFSGPTARGHYNKTRGYVWYPIDQADFLQSHSTKCLKILKSIVQEHPENELVWIQ
jgi:superfamily II DNA or RNA helicase